MLQQLLGADAKISDSRRDCTNWRDFFWSGFWRKTPFGMWRTIQPCSRESYIRWIVMHANWESVGYCIFSNLTCWTLTPVDVTIVEKERFYVYINVKSNTDRTMPISS